ncbi:PRC-barrel domain-containing protein [Prosthecomicrobium sp. N25]|uniref:PRC-barrel domain-containing protein n=1 Tax=Prosthecomicrobium sp. N25 TaxID=3129254 RepID=UPI003076EDF9
MMKKLIVISALAAVPLTGAYAQTTPSTTTPPAATTDPSVTATPPGTTVTPMRDPAAKTTTTTTTTSTSNINYVAQQSADQMLASKLIGTTVRGSGDENIGEINDLLVQKDGKIHAVVIGVGGFLGIGEKNVAVPFESVQMMADANNSNTMRVTIASTKDALKQAPEFRRVNDNRSAGGSTTSTGATGSGTTRPVAPQ